MDVLAQRFLPEKFRVTCQGQNEVYNQVPLSFSLAVWIGYEASSLHKAQLLHCKWKRISHINQENRELGNSDMYFGLEHDK